MLKRLHRRALRDPVVTGRFGPEQEVSETCRGGSTMAHLYTALKQSPPSGRAILMIGTNDLLKVSLLTSPHQFYVRYLILCQL